MNTKILIGTSLLAVIAGIYIFSRDERPKPNATEPSAPKQVESTKPSEDEPDIFAIAKAEANLPADYVLTPEQKEKIMGRREEILRKQRAKEMNPTDEELKIMFDTPVEFYGQVLDQFDNPVIGAEITCEWAHPGSWGYMGPGYSPRKLRSDAPDGRFEISNLKAMRMSVAVYPPKGYDEQVRDEKEITIAKTPDRLQKKFDFKNATPEQLANFPFLGRGPEAYKGDKAKPAIFRLKKL